jgi:4-amino-4-deoxy-L-arabinose transferase-like glycosyltransferase
MVAFLAFAVLTFVVRRKAFFILAVPVILATAVYLPAFWNNTGTFGQPARAIRSLKDPDPRDANSNLSRDLEAINVRATIAAEPLLGVGFGKPFLQVVAIPDISFFPFWNYEAHHNILWVWMKVGAGGFIVFFVVMGGGLARAASLARSLREPDARVFAALTVCGVVMALVFSYVDLGLTSSRVPVVLGTLLGTVSVLDRIYLPPGEAT